MPQSGRGIPRLTCTLLVSLLAGSGVEANGPPIHTETAFVTGLQGEAFRSFVRTVDKSAPGRDLRVISVPLIFPYELIPNRLVVGGAIPYLDKELETKVGGSRRRLENSGFGDVTLFSKVQVLQKDRPGETTRLTLLGRVKLPTGEHHARDPDGNFLARPLQVGTGSFDISGGAVLTNLKQRWGVNADLLYTATTEDESFRFGNALRYDLALAFRVAPKVYEAYPSPQLNLFLEFNGETQERNRLRGDSLADSGGTTIFVSPGIQYMFGRTLLIESSVQLPVVENLNGDQLETDTTFTLGIRWLVF
jgi:hypothetical protein